MQKKNSNNNNTLSFRIYGICIYVYVRTKYANKCKQKTKIEIITHFIVAYFIILFILQVHTIVYILLLLLHQVVVFFFSWKRSKRPFSIFVSRFIWFFTRTISRRLEHLKRVEWKEKLERDQNNILYTVCTIPNHIYYSLLKCTWYRKRKSKIFSKFSVK